jgi:DNA-binding MarR family transcriptional regulator
MDKTIKSDLLQAIFRFKKTGFSVSNYLITEMKSELTMPEIFALKSIKERAANSTVCNEEGTAHDDMHSLLCVSKAAVSQMLGSLEKKGYIERDIDRKNRRRIIISLTEKGIDTVKKSEKTLDKLVTSIISGFGEAQSRRLVSLVNGFSEIVEALGEKTALPHKIQDAGDKK